MAADVLREFLVSLGYKIDAGSEKKFTASLAASAKAAAKVGAAITAMAAAIQAGVVASSRSLESLYYASRRTGATAENIRALGFAVGQMGGSADDARSSLEALGRFLRTNPGAEGFLQSLGISTRDTNGRLRDTTRLMQDLGRQFRRMPYAQAYQYAQVLGIDERTLMALIEGTEQFSARYRQLARSIGVDLDQSARASTTFMNQLRELGTILELIWLKVAQEMLKNGLAAQFESFNTFLVTHSGQIAHMIERIIRAVLWLTEKLIKFGLEAVPYLERFAEQADKVATAVGGWENVFAGVLAYVAGTWVLGMVGAIGRVNAAMGAGALGGLLRFFGPAALAYALNEGLHQLGQQRDNSPQGQQDARNRWRDRGTQGGPGGEFHDTLGTPTLRDRIREWWNSTPRGIRNNNPLNLGYRADQPGVTGSDGRFGVYGTMEAGVAAAARQLLMYQERHQRQTLAEIISRWAPASDRNDTSGYIARVSSALGIDRNAPVNLRDPSLMARLVGQMAQVETGRPLAPDVINRGVGMALGPQPVGGAGVTVQQNTTINVTGSDPAATGRAVAAEQGRVNADVFRTARSAIR